MYSEEEIKQLAEDENELTEEEILVLLAALHTTLDELEKEIRLFYQKYGKDGIVTYAEAKQWVSSTNHVRRMVFLNQGIADIVTDGFNNFEQTFRFTLTNIIEKEAKFFGITVDIDELLNTPWGVDGLTALERLSIHRKKHILNVNCNLKRSILRGDSIFDVLDEMSKYGDKMDWQLTRLLRSESNAMSSIVHKQGFIANGYTHYKFVHVDRCSCEQCESMEGKIFPIEEYEVGITANPLHSNCKDTTVPI